MMSYTRSAIQIAENYVTDCSEFSILDTSENFDENLIGRYGSEYNVVVRVYSGESDKLSEIIRQDLFEHFKKKAPEKLKNNYVPSPMRHDIPQQLTVFIVGRT